MNWIQEQEYKSAIEQLRYYQAIKEHYELMMQEERTIQELDYLKRYANQVVYPAIEKAKKVREDYLYLQSKEQESKREKEMKELRDLSNAVKLFRRYQKIAQLIVDTNKYYPHNTGA